MNVKLGQKVKCLLSGLEGICDHIVYNQFTQNKIGIQPMGDGKTIPEGWCVDVSFVEILDEKPR